MLEAFLLRRKMAFIPSKLAQPLFAWAFDILFSPIPRFGRLSFGFFRLAHYTKRLNFVHVQFSSCRGYGYIAMLEKLYAAWLAYLFFILLGRDRRATEKVWMGERGWDCIHFTTSCVS